MILQRMIQAAFGQGVISLVLSADTTNLNVFTAVGSPVAPVEVQVTINAGVTVGATSVVNYALSVGQFAAGSRITIDNYGSIQGAGGAANGGTGGSAINANFPNQTVIINNKAGASIYGGGGGGSQGGTGGTGGTGGGGYYDYWGAELYDDNSYVWLWTDNNRLTISYGAYANVINNGSSGNVGQYGNYLRGSQRRVTSQQVGSGETAAYVNTYHSGVSQLQRAYTSGGAGGTGGAGGAGGRGQGYNSTKANGSAGAAGAAGAAGGTNAGAGGAGGQGGTGGNGGDWGQPGATGLIGFNGAVGANGNNGAGGAGAIGASAPAAGLAGAYLVKGAASVTLNNSGTVAGRLL